MAIYVSLKHYNVIKQAVAAAVDILFKTFFIPVIYIYDFLQFSTYTT